MQACVGTWKPKSGQDAHAPAWLAASASAAWRTLWLFAALFLGQASPSSASTLILDGFAYPNSTAARAAWVADDGPPVGMAVAGAWGTGQVMVASCDFATRSDRCFWDRTVSLDLASFTDFALDVFVPDPGAFSSFTLYFRSGNGWYSGWVSLGQAGWQTLRFSRLNFVSEGTPTGWDQIDGIRLSPWKAASRNTYLALRQLRAFTPPLLLVEDTGSSDPATVQDTIARHQTWLGQYRIDTGVIPGADVGSNLLQGCSLVILPYNESVSDAEMTTLENFVASGGKLLVYYLLPSRLPALLGVRPTGWTAGDYAAWVFADPAIPGLPARVLQASWNITVAVPDGTLNSRVVAGWEDSEGVATGQAAWLASDHGLFMSHILLGDDAAEKTYALLCLIGYYLPEVWPGAAGGAIDQIGYVGPYSAYDEAVLGIRSNAAPTLRAVLVNGELAAAATNRDLALTNQAGGAWVAAVQAAQAARTHMVQAYIASLKPVTPEFRAFWEANGTGPFPGDWPRGIAPLATNAFSAVFPNMLSGGVAHYDSAFLPHSAVFTNYGDQLTACVSAARAQGLQVHVWSIDWNLVGAPQSFIDTLRAASRTQVSSSGTPVDWLCPSHPDNQALELNALLEVVSNYDVDGIHFDYIRYPDSSCCYCPGCGTRFQSQTGHTVTNWPGDVLATGTLRTAFLDWRRSQITHLVEAVHDGAKALKPAIKISAAVFPDAPSAYDDVGQDWRLWLTNGLVDFLCPMDYTTNFVQFTNYMVQQLGDAAGKIPIYPGIGAFLLENDAMLAQLQATRAAGTGGFLVFDYTSDSVSSLLPALHAGATAPDEPDEDKDLIPDSWERRWFGNLTTAGPGTDFDHDGMSDYAEYVAGTDPTDPHDVLTVVVQVTGTAVELAFQARAVEGLGYQNAVRHYALEQADGLGGSTWEPVAGFADCVPSLAAESVVVPLAPSAGQARCYRVRVWLQQAP